MRPELLLRAYPQAWRERYGEELSALIEAQRPLSLGQSADLLRGALAAHFHPLTRDLDVGRSSRRKVMKRLSVPFLALGLLFSGVLAVLLVLVVVLGVTGPLYIRAETPAGPLIGVGLGPLLVALALIALSLLAASAFSISAHRQARSDTSSTEASRAAR